jgi:hypothetical protein
MAVFTREEFNRKDHKEHREENEKKQWFGFLCDLCG